MLTSVLWKSWGTLSFSFLTNYDSRLEPENAGIFVALLGSFWLLILTAIFSIPIGIGAAIYLEEFATDNWLTRLIRLNIANLASVPSIVFGLLGLTVFVRMFSLFQAHARVIPLGFASLRIPMPLGPTLIAGALTLSLLILPIIIIACQESLRSIPQTIRHAAYGLGATQWQAVRDQVFPAALPGMMTGVILAVSRAIGETAPLVVIGVAAFILNAPGDIEKPSDIISNPQGVLDAPFSEFTVMPFQIFTWASQAKPEYENTAAAGIVVLLVVLLVMNGIAVYTRYRFQKHLKN